MVSPYSKEDSGFHTSSHSKGLISGPSRQLQHIVAPQGCTIYISALVLGSTAANFPRPFKGSQIFAMRDP